MSPLLILSFLPVKSTRKRALLPTTNKPGAPRQVSILLCLIV